MFGWTVLGNFGLFFVLQNTLGQDLGSCRKMVWSSSIPGKAFSGHVIARRSVTSQGNCQVQCYLNNQCISFNYYPALHQQNCELSSSGAVGLPANLVDQPAAIYQGSENHCLNKPCPAANMTCHSGFGLLGYQCICPNGYFGDICQKGYIHLGCFKDTKRQRALPRLLSLSSTIRGCYNKALKRGYNVFSLQIGGECWSGAAAEYTYNQHGPSEKCSSLKGGAWANDVYKIVS